VKDLQTQHGHFKPLLYRLSDLWKGDILLLGMGNSGTIGETTHETILNAAMNLATVRGLDGLTIGSLASYLGMSKSGIFSHFGSKENLQIEVVKNARKSFIHEVIEPVFQSEKGVRRLWGYCSNWISYAEKKVLDGGCFFSTTSMEFDAKPGHVRDEVARNMRNWMYRLRREARIAVSQGELTAEVDANQLTFEIHSLCMGANWFIQMFEDYKAALRARQTIRERLLSFRGGNWPGDFLLS
jgi:AcrR family transcriptional regulator